MHILLTFDKREFITYLDFQIFDISELLPPPPITPSGTLKYIYGHGQGDEPIYIRLLNPKGITTSCSLYSNPKPRRNKIRSGKVCFSTEKIEFIPSRLLNIGFFC